MNHGCILRVLNGQHRNVRACRCRWGALLVFFVAATIVNLRPWGEHGVVFAGLRGHSVGRTAAARRSVGKEFPTLTVFDLDACFWNQEMYALHDIPGPEDVEMGPLGDAGEGVVGAVSGSRVIRMHPGSLKALQDYVAGKTGDMKIGVASTADTPHAVKIGKAALNLLEVVPGKTAWEVLMSAFGDDRAVYIGRSPPLSSDKAASHFPMIREATGIRYDEMLFFDDCGWGDHCGNVERKCQEPDTGKGPVTRRTPSGLTLEDWNQGLAKWRQRVQAR